jgi:zinc transporter 1/2/3
LDSFLQIGGASSAGVIVGAGFFHLLPHSTSSFLAYWNATNPSYRFISFPFAELISIGLLTGLVMVDKLVLDGSGHSHHHHSGPNLDPHAEGLNSPKAVDQEMNSLHEKTDVQTNGSHDSAKQNAEKVLRINDGEEVEHKKLAGTAYIFLFAMSLHCLFEGLGIGAASDSSEFWILVIAVCAHKITDGLALGIPMFNAHFSKSHSVVCIIFCSAMAPLGVGIGWAATSVVSGPSQELVSAVIFALTFGCFLYISLVELLPSTLASKTLMNWKLGAFIAGWGIMAALSLQH